MGNSLFVSCEHPQVTAICQEQPCKLVLHERCKVTSDLLSGACSEEDGTMN